MHGASKLFYLVGVFLIVSVLWPYDPTTDTAEYFRTAPRPPLVFPTFEPPSYVAFEDRWENATTKFIFLQDATVLPGFPVVVSVPLGRTILPGTEYLVFAHDIRNPDGSPSDVQLAFTGANGAGWRVPLVGAETKVRIYEEMNDWSPDPNTRWGFTLATDGGAVVVHRLRLDIQRVEGRLPDAVEYEDGWNRERTVRVHEGRGALYDARIVSGEPLGDTSTGMPGARPGLGSTPPDVPVLGRVPARNVAELQIELVYNSSTPSELHYRPTLFFRGANLDAGEWEAQDLPPTLADPAPRGGRFMWRLPIDPEMWDSPFASQTRWQVMVNWRGETTDYPVYMDGDFHFWMDVHRATSA